MSMSTGSRTATGQVVIKCRNCRGGAHGTTREVVELEPEMTLYTWIDFIDRLIGPEACDFPKFSNLTEEQKAKVARREPIWKCAGDHRFARKILADMGLSKRAIGNVLNYCAEHSAPCDCQIFFNTDEEE